MRNRIDVEDIVLSAYKSFFLRNQRSEFDLAGWDELWSILAMITVWERAERRRFVRAGPTGREGRGALGRGRDGGMVAH